MSRYITHLFLGVLIVFSFLALSYSVRAFTITDTTSVGVSAIVGSLPVLDPGGGGGSGFQSGVKFSGFAYPNAIVTIQKGLTKIATLVANSTGAFSIVVPEESTQLFTLFATDTDGRRSTLLNFPTVLYSGYLTDISGIRFAPTIVTDKLAVKQGDYLTVAGAAVPQTALTLSIQGFESKVFTLTAHEDGRYSITVPINLTAGEYIVKINYTDDTRSSKSIRVIVGGINVYQAEATTNIPGDCNVDQRITLVDFSVLAYWYNKKNPPACVDTNKDGTINLTDFSILAFYWN